VDATKVVFTEKIEREESAKSRQPPVSSERQVKY